MGGVSLAVDFLQILLGFLMLIATIVYVRLTYRVALANERMLAPQVALWVERGQHAAGILILAIRNCGIGVAKDVKVAFEPDLPYHGTATMFSNLKLFAHGFDLATSQETRHVIGDEITLPHELTNGVLKACLTYSDVRGRVYKREIPVDLGAILQITSAKDAGLGELAVELRRARLLVEKALDCRSQSGK